MQHLAPEKFEELIEAGHETRNVEFKSAFDWSDDASVWLREKVIQTVLGMTNTRDGGTIIIGIPEVNGTPDLTVGVNPTQLGSFDRYDDIKATIDSFGSNVNFDLADAQHGGHDFVVISVQEFAQNPSICKKDGVEHGATGSGKYMLRKGQVYARGMTGPESTICVTDTEMAEIIEMAVDKGRRNLYGRGYRHVDENVGGFATERGDF